ncbi:MAG: tetratricopeptide repeat protein [Bacteroidales bacterium]
MPLRLNDKVSISNSFNNIGILYALQKKYKKALLNFEEAKKVALEVGSKDNLQSIYRNMSEAYEDLYDYNAALEYFKLYEVVKDSMFNEDKTRKIEEMEARFEHEKKEKAIALQKAEIELLSKDLEIETVKRNGLFIGLLCTILGGIYLYISLRQRMKKNRLIREQERKLEEEKLLIAQLERDNYERELEFKKNELTSHALHMIQKNELLDTLKENIGKLEREDQNTNSVGYRSLKRIINGSVQIDKDWENFNRHFEQVHHGFYSKLKGEYEILTSNDLRLSAMLRMNLTSKEVAAIMNVSPESVKKARYRLRKKLKLEEEADLHSFMMKV